MPATDPPSASAARVARVVRYPVKGLRGVETTRASIAPGRGLRGDRVLAVERGALLVERPEGWNPRETYFHTAMTEQIARFETAVAGAEDEDGGVVTITAPSGRSVDIRLGAAGFAADRADADAFFGAELPAGPLGPPAIARTGVQLWDWPAAQISVINLATLRALEESAGVPVDLRRFRANVYLDGLPAWQEFALLGTRIRIGDAEFEVFQPTDRCRATTVDPATAVSDLNVPALLAGRFGHMYCGVYARPVTGGTIGTGDPVEVLPATEPVGLAGAGPAWPRAGTLVERVEESAAVTSFWFRDAGGFAQRAAPGQHIRVHLPGAAAPAWRCYTISGVRDDAFRISVKRDGRVSTALHDAWEPGAGLIVSGPFGEVTIDPAGEGDVLLLSAGVGITPTAAMVGALAAAGSRRRVRVLHVDRDLRAVPLWDEVREAAAALPDARVELFLTRETPELAAGRSARLGRPDRAVLAELLDGLDAASVTAYACGPAAFTADLRAALAGLGVDDGRVRVEVFFSPTTADLAEPREPSSTGPHVIRVGEDEVVWRPESGTILDAVEGIGLPLPSGCRTGVCGTCVQTLVAGEVEYLQDPLNPPRSGRVLVCCSAPVGDVVLGVAEA